MKWRPNQKVTSKCLVGIQTRQLDDQQYNKNMRPALFNQASSSYSLMDEMNVKELLYGKWESAYTVCVRALNMAWHGTQRMYEVCVLYSEAHDL